MEISLNTRARPKIILLLAGLSVALVLALFLARSPAAAAGGSFSGSYTGPYNTTSGSGSASFIGASNLTSTFRCRSSICLGTGTIISSTQPSDSLKISLSCLKPCPNPIHFKYWVNGGTGRFDGASGSGTAIYTLSASKNVPFTASFSGTLSF